MKKILLILMVMMMALPMAFAADRYTDFSRMGVQDRIYSGVTGGFSFDSYQLSSTVLSTGINMSDAGWGYCSLITGGSQFRGVPLSYYDYASSYEHHSFLVLEDSSLIQYGSDCSVIDEYNFLGTSVSHMGIINSGYTETDRVTLPYISFLYKKTSDSKVYAIFLTLDSTTSELKFLSEVEMPDSADWETYNFNMGMAGGWIDSDENNMPPEYYYFGIYNKYNDKMVIFHDWDSDGIIDDYVNIADVTVNGDETENRQIYFDDWDMDGNNEFILLTSWSPDGDGNQYDTFYFEINRINPLAATPFYSKEASDTYTSNGVSSTSAYYVNNYIHDGFFSICQLGDRDSVLEACATIGLTSDADNPPAENEMSKYYNTLVIKNDFDSAIQTIIGPGNTYYDRMYSFIPNMFTVYYNNYYIACGMENYASSSYQTVNCYDIDGTRRLRFNSTVLSADSHNSNGVTIQNSYLRVFAADIDGNTSTIELLFSTGEAERIVPSGNNIVLTDWESTFDGTYKGNIYVQDLNGNSYSELIYIDDTRLRIYSMNNTPFEFLNAEDVGGVTPTTTTPSVTTTTIAGIDYSEGATPVIFQLMQKNITTLIGLSLILGLAIMAAFYSRGNVIISILGGIIGSVIAVTLGLISGGVLVIMIISLVILAILGLTVFKGSGG